MSYRQTKLVCNRRTSGIPHDVDPELPTEQRAYQSLAMLSTGKQCSHKDLPALKQHSLTINMASDDSKWQPCQTHEEIPSIQNDRLTPGIELFAFLCSTIIPPGNFLRLCKSNPILSVSRGPHRSDPYLCTSPLVARINPKERQTCIAVHCLPCPIQPTLTSSQFYIQ